MVDADTGMVTEACKNLQSVVQSTNKDDIPILLNPAVCMHMLGLYLDQAKNINEKQHPVTHAL